MGTLRWRVCVPPSTSTDIKHGFVTSELSLVELEGVRERVWRAAAQGPLISQLLTPCLYVRTHRSVSLLNVKRIACHWSDLPRTHWHINTNRGRGICPFCQSDRAQGCIVHQEPVYDNTLLRVQRKWMTQKRLNRVMMQLPIFFWLLNRLTEPRWRPAVTF